MQRKPTRRDLLKGTATAGAGMAGIGVMGSASASNYLILENNIWFHEDTYGMAKQENFGDHAASAVRGMSSILRNIPEVDESYCRVMAYPEDGTEGDIPNDPGGDDLRELIPDWRTGKYITNVHLINQGVFTPTHLGRSSSRVLDGDDSGECYVNLGHKPQHGATPQYLFPNIILHEWAHCYMNYHDVEHGLGTPMWGDSPGTPSVMGTGYAQEGTNYFHGDATPEEDCFNNDWSDGTTYFQPDPVPVISDETEREMGEQLGRMPAPGNSIDVDYTAGTLIDHVIGT